MELYEKIKTDLSVVLFIIMFVAVVYHYFKIDLDPTDNAETGERSGLRYYKDHGTGLEYISNGSAMMLRYYKDHGTGLEYISNGSAMMLRKLSLERSCGLEYPEIAH